MPTTENQVQEAKITRIKLDGNYYTISLGESVRDDLINILKVMTADSEENEGLLSKEDKQHLDTLYSSLIGDSESPDSDVVDTLKEVLDLLRNFPESQDLKELLDNINTTINNLDLSQVGANGKYIKFISQDNGQLAATAESFNTAVTNASTDNNAPTSKAVYNAINTAINNLDITDISNTAGKTISKITETDGKIGAEFQDIQITKAQAGLDQVDNTSDTNKPISSATQTALNAKQDTLTNQTAYSAKGSSYKVPQITTNTLGQVTLIEEKDISTTSITNTSGSESISVNTSDSSSKTLNVVTRDTAQTISGQKTFTSTLIAKGPHSNSGSVELTTQSGDFGGQINFKGDGHYASNITLITEDYSSGTDTATYTQKFQRKNGTIAIDEDVVHNTGDETIEGQKTFGSSANKTIINNGFIQIQKDNNTATQGPAIRFTNGNLMGETIITQTATNGVINLALPNKDGTIATTDDLTEFVISDVTGVLSSNYLAVFKTGTATENPGLHLTKKGLAYSEETTGARITAESSSKLGLWAGFNGGVAVDIPTSTTLAFIPEIGLLGASASKNLGSSTNPWTNLYLSGNLSDSTNSIAIADIAVDDEVVHNTGDEAIYGNKEFYNSPVTCGGAGGSGGNDIGGIIFKGVSGLTGTSTTLKAHTNGGSSESYSILLPARSGTLATTDDIQTISGADNWVQLSQSNAQQITSSTGNIILSGSWSDMYGHGSGNVKLGKDGIDVYSENQSTVHGIRSDANSSSNGIVARQGYDWMGFVGDDGGVLLARGNYGSDANVESWTNDGYYYGYHFPSKSGVLGLQRYMHNVVVSNATRGGAGTASFTFKFITDSAEALTQSTLCKALYDAGFNSATAYCPASGMGSLINLNSGVQKSTSVIVGVYSTTNSGTTIYAAYIPIASTNNTTMTINTDTTINTASYAAINTVTDMVQEVC